MSNFFLIREEENDTPKLNVYIPPNLRKKVQEEETVPDRAADGSEIIETVVVEEAPINDVRTDPDGQSSEPDVAKDVPVVDVAKDQSVTETDVDKNDSGFIECGKYISD